MKFTQNQQGPLSQSQLEEHLRRLVKLALERGEVPEKEIKCLAEETLCYRKVCTVCDRMLPATVEYYAAHPRTRDGYQSQCRDCNSIGRKKLEEEKKHSVEKLLDYVEPVGELDYFEGVHELDYREPRHGGY